MKNKYSPETAGARMIENVPLCQPEENIFDIRKRIFERVKEFETLNYIYVVDKEKRLLGVFSIREILQSPERIRIEEVMEEKVIKVDAYTDQEKVAILALKHNLKAIPVIDNNNKFLGIVPSDIILDILHLENVEDFLKAAGIHSSLAKTLKGSSLFLTKIRTPWLILGLFGGIFAAQIVNFFETPLKTHFILAAFIPLIVYMADAVGTQTETLFIRSLVLNSQFGIKKYLLREIKISILMGLILGSFLFFLSILWFNTPYFIGIILSVSLFFTILIAILIGIFIPWFLQKLKKDPAIGSGPFGTIIRDVLSLIIYFVFTSLMLKFFD